MRIELSFRLFEGTDEGISSTEDEIVVLQCGSDHSHARILQRAGSHETTSCRAVGDNDIDLHVTEGVHRGDDGVRTGMDDVRGGH